MRERENRKPYLPVPRRVGMADVVRLEELTARYRSVDYPRGGGACRDELRDAAAWAEGLLDCHAAADVRRRLVIAVADLHNVAAWTCFDTGERAWMRRHWARALELAREAGADDLVANIRYRLGRVHLHDEEPRRAADQFEAGLFAVGRGRSSHTTALLRTNQAWAHAKAGREAAAQARLSEAFDHLDRADGEPPAAWSKFFDLVDFVAMTGVVHTELAQSCDARHAPTAVAALHAATERYGADMGRSRVFSLIALSTANLLGGDDDEAVRVARAAVEAGAAVHSERVSDRIRPLGRLAHRRGNRELAAVVSDFVGSRC
ncbi:tetratricopeptide repeat protein [Saccharothrix australiensis]|nr:tetratricopeptide repeat protein [Saccharothrix australiensis]